jgi:hypothetical protein
MATNFPNSLDALTNPNASDPLSSPSHSQQHTNLNDAVEAIETKIGVNGSSDTNSLQYKIAELESSVYDIENNTSSAEILLGLEGNNDLTVYGIENPTNVDSFAKNAWKTVRYNLQVTKGSDVYTSEILATQAGSDLLVSESNIISSTSNNIFTYTFEENSGIISLRVTPVSGSIAVRFIRTALKA